jgi:2-polyprenyl-3-methyl-5-hydroxy-6-metoxy-1,4-benzoquinol methylase
MNAGPIATLTGHDRGRAPSRTGLADCPSCGSTHVALIGRIPDAFGFGGVSLDTAIPGGSLHECPQCHLLFRHPRLAKDQLDRLYRAAAVDIWQDSATQRPDWERAAHHIRAMGPDRTILDVGCFDGGFLAFLGDAYRRSGIEIQPQAAQRAADRGVEIVGSDLATLDGLRNRYDVVVALDVIEHVADPKAFLRALASVTKPEGTIIIATGNTDALPWKIMGGQYWYCSIAEHIAFINPRWCSKVADELQLTVLGVERYSHKPAPISRAIMHAGANVLFRFLPAVASTAKRFWSAVRGKRQVGPQALPPPWLAANDHIIVRFRKSAAD